VPLSRGELSRTQPCAIAVLRGGAVWRNIQAGNIHKAPNAFVHSAAGVNQRSMTSAGLGSGQRLREVANKFLSGDGSELHGQIPLRPFLRVAELVGSRLVDVRRRGKRL